jgi:PIN domain nuclease of toxin-antitoxin system
MPGLLLDTRTLVDYLSDRGRLSKAIFARIEGALQEGRLAISVVSLLQLRDMRRIGSISEEAIRDFEQRVSTSDLRVLPVDHEVVRDLDSIPDNQPLADRLLAATAQAKHYELITDNVGVRIPSLQVESPRPATFEVEVRAANETLSEVNTGDVEKAKSVSSIPRESTAHTRSGTPPAEPRTS